ncbi:MAG: hypothetical protein RBJ76_03280 [Stenomitos frigidus ULC029]
MAPPPSSTKRRQQRALARDTGKRQQNVSLHFVGLARNFFKRIGLPFRIVPSYESDPKDVFFKGCWLDRGTLVFCPGRVQVGELMHEAGHLALTPKDQWHLLEPGSLTTSPPLGDFALIGDAAVEAWDYAAALAADVPILTIFRHGFDGNGLQVWEQFDHQMHPGFALLRFLGMSNRWGTCDRWLVGKASVEQTKETFEHLMKSCTFDERKLIIKAFEARLKC